MVDCNTQELSSAMDNLSKDCDSSRRINEFIEEKYILMDWFASV